MEICIFYQVKKMLPIISATLPILYIFGCLFAFSQAEEAFLKSMPYVKNFHVFGRRFEVGHDIWPLKEKSLDVIDVAQPNFEIYKSDAETISERFNFDAIDNRETDKFKFDGDEVSTIDLDGYRNNEDGNNGKYLLKREAKAGGKGGSKSAGSKSGGPNNAGSKSGGPNSAGSKSGAPNSAGSKSGGPISAGSKSGAPNSAGSKSGSNGHLSFSLGIQANIKYDKENRSYGK